MMWLLTLLFAAATVVAAVAMATGSPTAINGVIGAGICTVVCAACAWAERP
jgi:hypothetical protein